jgi:hypothetical protein
VIEKLSARQLSPLEHKVLFVCIASSAIALVCLYNLAVILLKGKNYIYLTNDGIEIIIQGITQKTHRIDYSSIYKLTLGRSKGKKFLSIDSKLKKWSSPPRNLRVYRISRTFAIWFLKNPVSPSMTRFNFSGFCGINIKLGLSQK